MISLYIKRKANSGIIRQWQKAGTPYNECYTICEVVKTDPTNL